MSTLTVAELEAQIDTDLDDVALQQIIDAVERDIEGYVGPQTAAVEEYDPELLTVLRLPAKGSAITSVVEYTDARSDPTKTTLAANDYELSSDGWEVRRLSDGTNARDTWGWRVVMTFTPVADTARRKQVAIELARLEITHTGYSQEKVGDWSGTSRGLSAERAEILERLDEALIT